MRWSGSSYIGRGHPRQPSLFARPAAVAMLAFGLCGCASLGLPFDEAAVDRDLTTGSIARVSNSGQSQVAQSDWQAVRQGIARAATEPSLEGTLAWSNPDTGTTGTLTVLDTVSASNDPSCRNFQTTVNDMRGVRHYHGETCQMTKGQWELYGVLADDSKLL